MNQEITSNTSSDFTVNSATGDAFISRAKAAEILGIPVSTLKDWILKNPAAYSFNENNQLDGKSLQKLAMSGVAKGYEKSAQFLEMTAEAGVKAYLYHQAGYQINAVEPKQELTLTESLKAMVAVSEAMDAFKAKQALMQKEIDEKASKEALAKLQRSFEGNQCPRGYLPKYKLAAYFDLPVSYFTDEFLGSVQQVTYPFSSGMGGLRTAVAYKLTDVMDLLGITE